VTKTRRKIKATPKPKKPSVEEIIRSEVSSSLSGFLTVANSISARVAALSQNIDRLGERIESAERKLAPLSAMEPRLLNAISERQWVQAKIEDLDRYKIVLEAYRAETKERLAQFEEWLKAIPSQLPPAEPHVNGTGGWKRFFT
jgi:chromosome segregation ATPase